MAFTGRIRRNQLQKIAGGDNDLIRLYESLFLTVAELCDANEAAQPAALPTSENTQIITGLVGVESGALDLGDFTGGTITDDTQIRPALQEVVTAVERIAARVVVQGEAIAAQGVVIDALVELVGLEDLFPRTDNDDLIETIGPFTGELIPNETTIKEAFQSIETVITALIELTGLQITPATINTPAIVPETLGAFTGETIPSNATIKDALQEIETDYEETLAALDAATTELDALRQEYDVTRQTVETEHP